MNRVPKKVPVTRIGIDIGGTFTDAVLETQSERFMSKVLTNAANPEQGVFDILRTIMAQAGCVPEDIALIVHGTTLATNALIERKGAKTAFLTTSGHRDVIEIRDETRFDLYDLNVEYPPALVPRDLRFGIRERTAADGEILVPLNEDDVREVARTCRGLGVEAIAIGFLHSYANEANESRAREIIQEELPGVEVSISAEVSPQIREYERFLTTCANAYIQPKMSSYLSKLEKQLQADGFRCPILLVLSSGALTTVETSCRFPVRLVESGPAGGAVYAAHVAAECGTREVLSFDMGGTTAKICLIDDSQPQHGHTFEVARNEKHNVGSGWPITIPVIDMVEIGAGGGSIAAVNHMGHLSVGPESAGSSPGPVCYARGGKHPTVTDANLVAELLDPDYFAGGTVNLDREATLNAFRLDLKELFGDDVHAAALGIREIVGENMAQATRIHAIEKGKSLVSRTLLAFGGAAPLHACHLANKLGIDRIVIPSGASVGSAIGFLLAPVAYEVLRSRRVALEELPVDQVNAMLKSMSDSARAVVEPALYGVPAAETRQIFMRYLGQGYEIPVVLPPRPLTDADIPLIRQSFEAEYERLFSRTVPLSRIEILTWSVLVSGPAQTRRHLAEPAAADRIRPGVTRNVVTEQGPATAQIHYRGSLREGVAIPGPALIVEEGTTIYVSDGFVATMTGLGHVECVRTDSKAGTNG